MRTPPAPAIAGGPDPNDVEIATGCYGAEGIGSPAHVLERLARLARTCLHGRMPDGVIEEFDFGLHWLGVIRGAFTQAAVRPPVTYRDAAGAYNRGAKAARRLDSALSRFEDARIPLGFCEADLARRRKAEERLKVAIDDVEVLAEQLRELASLAESARTSPTAEPTGPRATPPGGLLAEAIANTPMPVRGLLVAAGMDPADPGFGAAVERLGVKLNRLRATNDRCYQEVTNPGPREPRYIYFPAEVYHAVCEAIAQPGCKSKNKSAAQPAV